MKRILGVGNGSTAARRAEILERYRKTKLTQREFARQKGIGVSTLQLWLRKAAISQASEGVSLVEAPNLLSAAPVAASYRILFPNGWILEVRSGFQAQELGQLLNQLQEL